MYELYELDHISICGLIFKVLDYKDEEMVVTFIMLNRTKPMGGDVGVVYSQKGLMDALDALKKSVNSEQFKVPFQKGMY